jgi:hypothetical protein
MYNLRNHDDARSYYDKALQINANLINILSEKELVAFNQLMDNKNTK